MSNKGRPRTGHKPCPHCKSTKRDSNGQCHCRNVDYRERKKAEHAAFKAGHEAAMAEVLSFVQSRAHQ